MEEELAAESPPLEGVEARAEAGYVFTSACYRVSSYCDCILICIFDDAYRASGADLFEDFCSF